MISNAQLHHFLLSEIIEQGFVSPNEKIAKHFSITETELHEALYNLQDYHGVVLHPNQPKVWVIHPFSLAPTNFFLKSKTGQWWGNCAWCSLGAANLINEDLTIYTSIGAENTTVEVRIENGEVANSSLLVHFPIPMKKAWDNVMYTCSNMLLFETEKQVELWCERHSIPKGDIQPIENIWRFSKKWYGNHLNPNWKKWTADEAKSLFKEFGLTQPIWNLEGSHKRF